jgi:uncharacterized membrane protein
VPQHLIVLLFALRQFGQGHAGNVVFGVEFHGLSCQRLCLVQSMLLLQDTGQVGERISVATALFQDLPIELLGALGVTLGPAKVGQVVAPLVVVRVDFDRLFEARLSLL